jgi:multiple sugar transport system substrate-binding protein
MEAVVAAFKAKTGVDVALNTTDSASYQGNISTYLQGTPDDVFAWFAGYRMRFFAAQGLASELSDVWARIGASYTDAFRTASTGDDGRPYLVPFHTYPWVVHYRPSVFASHGYAVPATYAELKALAAAMRRDGLVPMAFADKDGWPAMGTFDILDLRLNGYDFHVGLAAGRQRWTDPKVRAVFERWRDLLPDLQPAALGRTWQDAARAMLAGDAGMYFAGTFAGEQADAAQAKDLDFFPFPSLGTAYDGETAIDAPINGFMLSRSPRNPVAARAFLEYVGTAEAQLIYVKANPNRIAAARDTDTSGYTGRQQAMVRVIGSAGRIAQFLDRDSRPDFTGVNGMQRFLQDFLADPAQDLDRYLAGIQAFWDSLT